METLSNENIIHIRKNGMEYIQFRRLLEYSYLKHGFTLKPMDFGMFRNYEEKRKEIEENIKNLGKEIGFTLEDVCRPKQTHTNHVERVPKEDTGVYIPKYDDVDGLVTSEKGKVLVLSFADCTPLLFLDPVKKAIGNTHSGWKGTLQQIGLKTVEKMQQEFGSKPEDLICCIGPHIRKCHFEVEKDVRDSFYEQFKNLENIEDIIDEKENGKYYIDTAAINKQILLKAGLKIENIIDSEICTVCNSDVCHSYRGDKEKDGRSISFMELI